MLETLEPGFEDFIKVAAAERYLRGGLPCRVEARDDAMTIVALEALDDRALADVIAANHGLSLVLSARRAAALGVRAAGPKAVRLALPASITAEHVRALADPTREVAKADGVVPTSAGSPLDVAAVELCKIASLLPASIVVEPAGKPAVSLDAATIMAFRAAAARSLERITEAKVPLLDAAQTRFVAFRSKLGGPQHYAILVGAPEAFEAPLCRIHSECFTGDLFGSMRCDCGQQLKGAIRRMEEAGGGIMLYMAQEGRGIGLVNKLRAYSLQDNGIDTVDANTHLGFEPDERDFLAAAAMLKGLGFSSVKLMTNNPDKVEQLAGHGIAVDERVEHSFAANHHNRFYLETKVRKSGHLLSLSEATRRGAA
jgi:GTP cyclohydrolase II